MTRVMFICHGNICRSTMAEFVFRDMVEKLGMGDKFTVSSSATSREEIGSPVYPGTKKILNSLNISCEGKYAVQLTKSDYDKYDYLLCMDDMNIRNALKIIGSDKDNKLKRLLDFTDKPRNIADPWYTGDFEKTFEDVLEGCQALLKHIESLDN